jgi:hypothetical protein
MLDRETKKKKRRAGPITANSLKALKVDESISDPTPRGAGVLQARKLKGGLISFYFRYTTSTGQRDRLPLGIGIDLAEARRLESILSAAYQAGDRDLRESRERAARENAAAIAAEKERLAAEDGRRRATLGALLQAYISELSARGKSSAKSVCGTLQRHVRDPWPTLWAKAASDITSDDLVHIISSVVQAGSAREADKLRSYLRSAYAAAIAARFDPLRSQELRSLNIRSNPAVDIQSLTVGSGTRDRALSVSELRSYWKRISHADDIGSAVLRFHLITGAQRIEQLARALSSDIDKDLSCLVLKDGKGRRKSPRLHLVPLLPSAIDALAAMQTSLGPYVVSVTHGESGAAYSSVRARLKSVVSDMLDAGELEQGPFTVGDIRRTVETRLAAAKVPKDVRAHLQSHGLGGVQSRNYDRYDYMLEKRDALLVLFDIIEGSSRG